MITTTPLFQHAKLQTNGTRMAPTIRVTAPLLMLLLVTVLALAPGGSAWGQRAPFPGADSLMARLTEDGIAPSLVYALFDDPRFQLEHSLLRVNVKQPSGKAGYERFVQRSSVQHTARFLRENRAVFDSLLANSPVDAPTVAAILKVESDLGGYPGKYRLMNVFATLTVLTSDSLETHAPRFWEHVLEDIPRHEHVSARKRADQRRKSKAGWAYRELLALLTLADQGAIDPLDAKGSWAGAFGMCQFLPSSTLAYGVDGDGDDIIDLHHLPDAIASVANYLASHRYKANVEKRRRKAIWHYNHSQDYVDCVVELADKVRAETSD